MRKQVEDITRLTALCEVLPAANTLLSSELSLASSSLLTSSFLLECRCVKLLSQLPPIFPIRRVTDDLYTIRGLDYPRDMSAMDDDRASAALGFLAHLLTMLSKYLSLPLRHKVVANASRSAVHDGPVALPLFKAKVDRERFERATLLLERDVDGLLAARDVPGRPGERAAGTERLVGSNGQQIHVLAKVELLFKYTLYPQDKRKDEHAVVRRRETEFMDAVMR